MYSSILSHSYFDLRKIHKIEQFCNSYLCTCEFNAINTNKQQRCVRVFQKRLNMSSCPLLPSGSFSIYCCSNGTIVSSTSGRAFSRRLYPLCRSLISSSTPQIDNGQSDTRASFTILVIVILILFICIYLVCKYGRRNHSSRG